MQRLFCDFCVILQLEINNGNIKIMEKIKLFLFGAVVVAGIVTLFSPSNVETADASEGIVMMANAERPSIESQSVLSCSVGGILE